MVTRYDTEGKLQISIDGQIVEYDSYAILEELQKITAEERDMWREKYMELTGADT